MNVKECMIELLSIKLKGNPIIEENTPFSSLGLDSLDIVDAVLSLEKMMNVTFNDEDLDGLSCIEDIQNLIKKSRRENNA